MRATKAKSNPAFTLIELLVVVAIVAILASIMMLNFQTSIARAKTSRALADMRSLTTALEAYHVDYNDYPNNPAIPMVGAARRGGEAPTRARGDHRGFNVTPHQITTPVGYISSLPHDPFRDGLRNVYDIYNSPYDKEKRFYSYYRIVSRADWLVMARRGGDEISLIAVDAARAGDSPASYRYLNRGAFEKYGDWVQWGAGPDGVLWNPEDDFVVPGDPLNALREPVHPPWGYSFDVPYDPTNGTLSFGNIIRTQMGGQKASPGHTFPVGPSGPKGGPTGGPSGRRDADPRAGTTKRIGERDGQGREVANGSDGAGSVGENRARGTEDEEFEKLIQEKSAKEAYELRPWWAFIFWIPGWLWLVLAIILVALLVSWAAWQLTKGQRLEEQIAMSSPSITDSDLVRLKGMKSVRRLHLAQSMVTDDGLRNLLGAKKLEALNLWNTPVTNVGLAHLAELPGLKELVLSETAVTDAGMAVLSKAPRLENLVLNGVALTDAGLLHLRGMQGLKYLNIRSTRVTAGGIEAFRRVNQGCEVVHSLEIDANTSGGKP